MGPRRGAGHLDRGLAELAAALGLALAGEADQALLVTRVRRWLEEHDRWLLVLDNADAPSTPTGLGTPLARLMELLPRVRRSQVLITTRDASWDTHATLTELELFTPPEATAFLLTRAGSGDERAAAEVAELLGWLPLALEQAGAYVHETRISLTAYLTRLPTLPAQTLAKGQPRDREPTDTLATTWQLSRAKVESVPGAVALLTLCAFLAPEDIPRELLDAAQTSPPEELAALADNPFAADKAVGPAFRG